MKKTAAIYMIINKIDRKVYLGSTSNFRGRRNVHISALRRGIHYNKHLQHAWNKCGEENFTISPIEKFKSISSDLLIKREALWIRNLNLTEVGYNINSDPVDQSGEKNPNWKGGPQVVKCYNCGEVFKRPPRFIRMNIRRNSKNYCSKKCKNESSNLSSERNPNWDRKRTDVTKRAISETRKRLCLSKGKENPNWRGGPKIVECGYCEKVFEKPLCQANRNKKHGHKNYCSRKCADKALSKKMSGKKNPAYKHGKYVGR